ncbi:hypothetical protein BMETH_93_1 [methanotrophic bacterial endosymbiont of Bathymodiolus sp.]|nr:hypothetical protein BMETH_93_1 [methanotrophic bacterial endosymbiont of Bathymodiolus sp.]
MVSPAKAETSSPSRVKLIIGSFSVSGLAAIVFIHLHWGKNYHPESERMSRDKNLEKSVHLMLFPEKL